MAQELSGTTSTHRIESVHIQVDNCHPRRVVQPQSWAGAPGSSPQAPHLCRSGSIEPPECERCAAPSAAMPTTELCVPGG
eukprot:4064087-Pleurochrysis_carterae.AAC.1